MRALVTGGTGFIGNHLVLELARRGWKAVCLTKRPVRSRLPKVTVLTEDLSQPKPVKRVKAAIGKIDVVFHLAAAVPHAPEKKPDSGSFFLTNALGTLYLSRLALELKADSFVYASSISVIGKPSRTPIDEDHPTAPLSAYALSKLYGELYCEWMRRTGLKRTFSFRISSPYGPGMGVNSVLPNFVRKALVSRDFGWMGQGKRVQNFVHVSDVVKAFLLAAEKNNPGIYNIGGPSSISMKKLAQKVKKLAPQCKSRIGSVGKPDPQEDFRWRIDSCLAHSKLGYDPQVALEQGLKGYIAHVQSKAATPAWWEPS